MKIFSIVVFLVFGVADCPAKEKAVNKPKRTKLTPEQIEEKEEQEAQKFLREQAEVVHLSKEMEKDKRRPSKADLSGNWSTGPNLVGITFQLEQDGEKITGRGYNWGCTGISSVIKMEGTYRGGKLTLATSWTNGEKYVYRMNYAEEDGYPRFQSKDQKSWPSFYTEFETVEQLAKQKEEKGTTEKRGNE
jgi:hypothetical protein